MTTSGPPLPRSIKHPWTADELRENRRFWILMWGPTAGMLAVVLAALIGAWPACSSLRSDVSAIKSGLEARDREIISIRNRVSDVEDTAGKARKEAGDALAKARSNETQIESFTPRVRIR